MAMEILEIGENPNVRKPISHFRWARSTGEPSPAPAQTKTATEEASRNQEQAVRLKDVKESAFSILTRMKSDSYRPSLYSALSRTYQFKGLDHFITLQQQKAEKLPEDFARIIVSLEAHTKDSDYDNPYVTAHILWATLVVVRPGWHQGINEYNAGSRASSNESVAAQVLGKLGIKHPAGEYSQFDLETLRLCELICLACGDVGAAESLLEAAESLPDAGQNMLFEGLTTPRSTDIPCPLDTSYNAATNQARLLMDKHISQWKGKYPTICDSVPTAGEQSDKAMGRLKSFVSSELDKSYSHQKGVPEEVANADRESLLALWADLPETVRKALAERGHHRSAEVVDVLKPTRGDLESKSKSYVADTVVNIIAPEIVARLGGDLTLESGLAYLRQEVGWSTNYPESNRWGDSRAVDGGMGSAISALQYDIPSIRHLEYFLAQPESFLKLLKAQNMSGAKRANVIRGLRSCAEFLQTLSESKDPKKSQTPDESEALTDAIANGLGLNIGAKKITAAINTLNELHKPSDPEKVNAEIQKTMDGNSRDYLAAAIERNPYLEVFDAASRMCQVLTLGKWLLRYSGHNESDLKRLNEMLKSRELSKPWNFKWTPSSNSIADVERSAAQTAREVKVYDEAITKQDAELEALLATMTPDQVDSAGKLANAMICGWDIGSLSYEIKRSEDFLQTDPDSLVNMVTDPHTYRAGLSHKSELPKLQSDLASLTAISFDKLQDLA